MTTAARGVCLLTAVSARHHAGQRAVKAVSARATVMGYADFQGAPDPRAQLEAELDRRRAEAGEAPSPKARSSRL